MNLYVVFDYVLLKAFAVVLMSGFNGIIFAGTSAIRDYLYPLMQRSISTHVACNYHYTAAMLRPSNV